MHANQTIIPVWKMVVRKRKINIVLIFYLDRGIEYASKIFRIFIKSNPMVEEETVGVIP